jgi:hypothetical protein
LPCGNGGRSSPHAKGSLPCAGAIRAQMGAGGVLTRNESGWPALPVTSSTLGGTMGGMVIGPSLDLVVLVRFAGLGRRCHVAGAVWWAPPRAPGQECRCRPGEEAAGSPPLD